MIFYNNKNNSNKTTLNKNKKITSSIFIFITFIFLLLLVMHKLNLISLFSKNINYYVSENGLPTNSGSKLKPLNTIDSAIEKIQFDFDNGSIKNNSTINVYITEGTYILDKELTINTSNFNSSNVKINFIGTSDTVITGSIPLSSEDFVQYDDNIYYYDISNINIDFNISHDDITMAPELIVNNEPMILSRYPNNDYLLTGSVIQQEQITSSDTKYKFTLNDDVPFNWDDTSNIYMQGFWSYDWGDSIVKLDGLSSNNAVSFTSDIVSEIDSDKRFFFFNSLDALDYDGEYYIDYDKKILYFIPSTDLTNCNINLSVLDGNLIHVTNSSNITFENITFQDVRGNVFDICNSSNIIINNCTIRNASGYGVVVTDGESNTISNCNIYNIGYSAITLEGGDRVSLTPSNYLVDNNEIFNYSRKVFSFTPGIDIDGVGSTISNNIIHDSPYIGIWFNGNDHIIENNELYNVCSDTNDVGAIYSGRDWTYRGNIIRENYIHDLNSSAPGDWIIGIYLDDCMSSANIYNNKIENVPIGMLIGGGRDLIIDSNTITNCDSSIVFDDRGLTWLDLTPLNSNLDNVPFNSELWLSKYPELESLNESDKGIPFNNTIINNILISSPKMQISDVVTKYGTISNNILD